MKMAQKKARKSGLNSSRIKSLVGEISGHVNNGQSSDPEAVVRLLIAKGFMAEDIPEVKAENFKVKFSNITKSGLQSVKAAKRISQYMMDKKLILKDAFGTPVSTTVTPSSPQAPQGNVVQTPSNQNNSAPVMYWPAATLWYQQGGEAAKKAGYEYHNAVSEYQKENQDSSRKLEMAGKMNMTVQSLIQGVAIATEALEGQVQRKRTGDQSATFEISVTEDSLKKMLKTLWVHNVAARSGSHPGVEQKLLEAQLTSRINRISSMTTADDGIPVDVSKGESPDNIWSTNTPTPPEQAPDQGQAPQGPETAAQTQPTPPMDGQQAQTPPPEQAPPGASPTPQEQETSATPPPAPEEAPTEEATQAASDAQGLPPGPEPLPEVEQEIPQTEEDTSLDALVPPEEAAQAAEQSEGEVPPGPEPTAAEQQPEPQMDMSQIQVAVGDIVRDTIRSELPAILDEYRAAVEETGDESEAAEGPEEIEDQEVENPETQEGEPVEDEGEPEYDEDDEGEEYDESEDYDDEDVEDEDTDMEEPEEALEEPEPEEDEEEETFYCIECDKEVTADEISECDNENCPLKGSIESETEEPEKQAPTDEESVQKHYALVDNRDHDGHEIQNMIVKGDPGIEGEFCTECQCMVSYSFDSSSWDAEDVSRWVKKSLNRSSFETKALRELRNNTMDESLDYFIDDDVLSYMETKGVDLTEAEDDVFGFSPDEIAKIVAENIGSAVGPTLKRIDKLKS
jgi:hypothetical protein